VPGRNYFLSQAETLLRFARETRNSKVAGVLLDKAASLTEKVEDLSLPDVSPKGPDVETGRTKTIPSALGDPNQSRYIDRATSMPGSPAA